ncbi:DUF4148 domain-containing protein [Hydrogenophaga sp.]|uniref:DUF4148 domain-containing protein n=1 Tax=Hydrogenophaga sp. TaxID=1904254 RepID=UPI0026253C2F|nr:DUF4148 domain-containing protein [Hydrogenophaga sp.]MCW5653332.1 DUF4148 domain-containing protein [Hydrogenophaga sp.]
MKLSSRILLPVALTIAAGAAFAEGPIQGNEVFAFQSTQSRAAVLEQAKAASAAQQIARGEIAPVVKSDVSVGKSRAQVAAETAEARRLGLLSYGEDMTFPTPAQAEQIRLAGVQATQVVLK